MRYEPFAGLEIHIELNTKTKMFCYCLNDPDEKHPNLNVCPVCAGHPGTLPFINEEAVKKVILTGLALQGEVPEFSQFDRKNYFYPDLPKGYQISQYKHPLVSGGLLELPSRSIRIRRVHLEEDTGRLLHDKETGASLVDFNRAGVPLMELVTEPDFREGGEIARFGEELQKILRYLGASDANMEKGQMRIEVNVSLRPEGEKNHGVKAEIKNINSFKFAAEAFDFEVKRQTALLGRGEKVKQETRGFNESKKETFSQRSKEEAHDYRYFPEPDLPPLRFSRAEIEKLRAELPELPSRKRERFIKEYGLDASAAEIISRDKNFADYYEETVSELREHDKETPEIAKKNLEKTAAAVLTVDLARILNKAGASVREARISAENFAELVLCVAEDKISNSAAKRVLEEMFSSGEDPSDVIARLGLWQISDAGDLENIAVRVLKENPKAADDYKKGKKEALQFLTGTVMKESRGKANPKIVGEIMEKLLS